MSTLVPDQEIALFLANYTHRFLTAWWQDESSVFEDMSVSAYEQVARCLVSLKIVKPDKDGMPFARWKFTCRPGEFAEITAVNISHVNRRELVDAVFGLAVQDGEPDFNWRNKNGPINIDLGLAEFLIKIELCEPAGLSTKVIRRQVSKYYRSQSPLERIYKLVFQRTAAKRKNAGIELTNCKVVIDRLTWTEEAKKYF